MLCWYWNWGSERIKDGTGIWTLGFLTLYHMLLLVCIHACVLSHFSHVQLCAILWTVACQAPLFMGEYCSGKNTGLNCHALQPGIFWLKDWTITSIVYPIFPKATICVLKWKVKVKVPQLCLTLCDPMGCTVHGILMALLCVYSRTISDYLLMIKIIQNLLRLKTM